MQVGALAAANQGIVEEKNQSLNTRRDNVRFIITLWSCLDFRLVHNEIANVVKTRQKLDIIAEKVTLNHRFTSGVMNMKKFILIGISSLALSFGAGQLANASTVDFETASNGISSPLVTAGFSFDVARITSGNCSTNGGHCLALNPAKGQSLADYSVMTLVGGGAFDLTSIWFNLLGNTSELAITGYDAFGAVVNSVLYDTATYANNTGHTVNFGGLFNGIFSAEFTNPGTGNVRVDDINASAVSEVPLPAALSFVLMGLAGLVGLRRFGKPRTV